MLKGVGVDRGEGASIDRGERREAPARVLRVSRLLQPGSSPKRARPSLFCFFVCVLGARCTNPFPDDQSMDSSTDSTRTLITHTQRPGPCRPPLHTSLDRPSYPPSSPTHTTPRTRTRLDSTHRPHMAAANAAASRVLVRAFKQRGLGVKADAVAALLSVLSREEDVDGALAAILDAIKGEPSVLRMPNTCTH
jgi:hypothetical protein